MVVVMVVVVVVVTMVSFLVLLFNITTFVVCKFRSYLCIKASFVHKTKKRPTGEKQLRKH